ncbi:MAG TPA: TIGR03790 family protein [Kiritimatiellia bacterium]|nr:TIGR03790 family protein [Kiritimatiellia bacterium]
MKNHILSAWLLLLTTGHLFAGGGPQNVLLVVNQTSSNSIALGRHYADLRGIPPPNILRLSITNQRNISSTQFTNEIHTPIFHYLDQSGLDDQIDYIVFSSDFPYRVVDGPFNDGFHASLTSTLFDNFYANTNAFGPPVTCVIASGSLNLYASTETPFRRPDPPIHPRYRITAMLAASTHAQALDLVERAVASDFTHPQAFVYFEHGEDDRRNIRWPAYEDAAFAMLFTPGGPTPRLVDGLYDPTPRTNTIGLMTGLRAYPRFPITHVLPGAIADHLTSFSGFLFNDTEGEGFREPFQMKLPAWISNGVAGTIGPVVEPCAFSAKFPLPELHLWYGRGFSLGESIMMSVANPYQSVFVGDPLAQPFAHPPQLSLHGFAENDIVSGNLPLVITSLVTGVTGGIDRVDLYINHRFHAFIDRRPLEPLNIITATIDGTDRSYTVLPTDTLPDIAAGLALAINAPPATLPVTATASGDRVMLRQKALATPGSNIAYSVSVAPGLATNLALIAWTANTHLLESPFPAIATSQLFTTTAVLSGDLFRAVVTRLDGVVITNEFIAQTGWSAPTVITNLLASINADPDLDIPEGIRAGRYSRDVYNANRAELAFHSRTPGWAGYAPSIQLTSSNPGHSFSGGGLFNRNTNTLTARGMIFLSAGEPELVTHHNLDTTALPDGPATLRIVAHRGDGPGTQSHLTRSLRIKNHTLECAITNLSPGSGLNLGETVAIHIHAEDPAHDIATVSLLVDGRIIASTNHLPYTFSIDTTDYGPGPLLLQPFAKNQNADSTLGEPVPVAIRLAQTLDFPPIPGQLITNLLTLTATASSGLPVTYTLASGPALLTPPHTLSFTGFGPVVLLADQPGNDTWNPAPTLTNTFLVNPTLTITAGPGGSASPQGIVVIPYTSDTNILLTSDLYWSIDTLLEDGQPNLDAPGQTAFTSIWLSVTQPHTIEATFTPLLTSQGTPHLWLASFGFTNDFEAAAFADQDGDGVPTWQEYIMLTDPTDPTDFLRIDTEITDLGENLLFWNAATGRLYGIYGATNLLYPFQSLANDLVNGIYTDTLHQASPAIFYKLDVILAP